MSQIIVKLGRIKPVRLSFNNYPWLDNPMAERQLSTPGSGLYSLPADMPPREVTQFPRLFVEACPLELQKGGPALWIYGSDLKVIFPSLILFPLFLYFTPSISLSVQAGSLSAISKFSEILSTFHAIHRGPRHHTREASTYLS